MSKTHYNIHNDNVATQEKLVHPFCGWIIPVAVLEKLCKKHLSLVVDICHTDEADSYESNIVVFDVKGLPKENKTLSEVLLNNLVSQKVLPMGSYIIDLTGREY